MWLGADLPVDRSVADFKVSLLLIQSAISSVKPFESGPLLENFRTRLAKSLGSLGQTESLRELVKEWDLISNKLKPYIDNPRARPFVLIVDEQIESLRRYGSS